MKLTTLRSALLSGLMALTLGSSLVGTTKPSYAQDGKVYVVYGGAKGEFGKVMEAEFKKNKAIELLAAELTKSFKFPRDMPIIMAETGEVNCWYDPEKHRLTISYDFAEFLVKLFLEHQKLDEAVDNAGGSLIFTIFHELGHALIGELDIPIAGREEDAADEFAVLMLNSFGKETQGCAVSAASWFELMSRRTSNADLPFWDEHSLDKQRFFDIFSLLYGADPNRFIFVEKFIPQQRLKRALRDNARKQRSWERLLAPHVRS